MEAIDRDLREFWIRGSVQRIFRDRANTFDVLSDAEFRRKYRFSRKAFFELLETFKYQLSKPTNIGKALLPVQRLGIALEVLESNSFQGTTAEVSGCSRSTVCRIVHEVSSMIVRNVDDFVYWPSDSDRLRIHAGFRAVSGIPGVIGCGWYARQNYCTNVQRAHLGFIAVVPVISIVLVVLLLLRVQSLRILRIYQERADPDNFVAVTAQIFRRKKERFSREEAAAYYFPDVLFTADGAADSSNTSLSDFYSLLLAESEIAFHVLSHHGIFIVKLFHVNEPRIVHYISNLVSSFGSVSILQPILSRSTSSECYLVCQDFNAFRDPAAPLFSTCRTLPSSFVDSHSAFLRSLNISLTNSLDRYRVAYEKRVTNSTPISSHAPPSVIKQIVSLFKSSDSDKFGLVSTKAKFGGVTLQPLYHKFFRFLTFSPSHPKPLVRSFDSALSLENYFDASSSFVSPSLSDDENSIDGDSFFFVPADTEKLVPEKPSLVLEKPVPDSFIKPSLSSYRDVLTEVELPKLSLKKKVVKFSSALKEKLSFSKRVPCSLRRSVARLVGKSKRPFLEDALRFTDRHPCTKSLSEKLQRRTNVIVDPSLITVPSLDTQGRTYLPPRPQFEKTQSTTKSSPSSGESGPPQVLSSLLYDVFEEYRSYCNDTTVVNATILRTALTFPPTPESRSRLLASKIFIHLGPGNWFPTDPPFTSRVAFDGSTFRPYAELSDKSIYAVNEYCEIAAEGYEKINLDNISASQIRPLPYTCYQAAPGCGKTTQCCKDLLACNDSSLVLTAPRCGREDIIERVEKNRYCSLSKEEARYFRTFSSFLQHPDVSADVLFVDEALMVHPGAIVAACVLSKAKKLFLYGDFLQIPFICRLAQFQLEFNDISVFYPPTKFLSTSHRCPKDVINILFPLYSTRCPQLTLSTSSTVSSSLHLCRISSHLSLPSLHNSQVLVFKQSEKFELQKIYPNVKTIHEFQGRQADNVALIRLSNKPQEEIYSSQPHCLVAVSRHTCSFTYFTAVDSDLLSSWLRAQISLSTRLRFGYISHFQLLENIPYRTVNFGVANATHTLDLRKKTHLPLFSLSVSKKRQALRSLLSAYNSSDKILIKLPSQSPDKLTELSQVIYSLTRDRAITVGYQCSNFIPSIHPNVSALMIKNAYVDVPTYKPVPLFETYLPFVDRTPLPQLGDPLNPSVLQFYYDACFPESSVIFSAADTPSVHREDLVLDMTDVLPDWRRLINSFVIGNIQIGQRRFFIDDEAFKGNNYRTYMLNETSVPPRL